MPRLSGMPVISARTNEDWNWEPFAFTADDVPEDFTGAAAKMGLRIPGQTTNAVEFTTANNQLTIMPPNEIGVTAPLGVIQNLAAGLYSYDLVITHAGGDIETILSGQIQVIAGIS